MLVGAVVSDTVPPVRASLLHQEAKIPEEQSSGGPVGVLVTNCGTPDAPTTAATRRYLAEFLADPRMIELPRWLWRLVLHGVVLRTRPRRSARLYESIWEENGSPFLLNSQAIVDALATRWAERRPGRVVVSLGMRYGNPSIRRALDALRDAGARRIVVLPLYPQYSAVTVGSTFDSVADTLTGWRRVPAVRFIDQYYDNPGYIQALATSIESAWSRDGRPDRLLFSFHGLPQSYCDKGDPYQSQCRETARLVAKAVGIPADQWLVAFQSRFGPGEWLRPYTEETIVELGQQRLRRVDAISPGFSVDCLETLEEIEIRGGEAFAEAGGGDLRYIPALNADRRHVSALAAITEGAIGDWA